MDYGEARAAINGENVTTLVVFGEDNAPALLGAYTLEGLALAVGPGGTAIGPNPPHHVLGRVDPRGTKSSDKPVPRLPMDSGSAGKINA